MSNNSSDFSRREFLQASGVGAVGVSLPWVNAHAHGSAIDNGRSVISIFNLGGPSQLDTFDPKPNAPAEIRGPFRPIQTKSSDIQISELFPRHAMHADKFSIVRSCSHTAAAVHDTGHQLMQTGRLFNGDFETPNMGCAAEYLLGRRSEMPASVVLPKPMGRTGGNLSHGQDAGFLGKEFDPFIADGNLETLHQQFELPAARRAFDLSREPRRVREHYGINPFGQSCLLARRLVEAGVRFINVNTFSTVFEQVTWDIHGSEPFSTMDDMRDKIAPMYDQAYAALLEDLTDRGMLDDTLVCNLAEFGRTPRINANGGRDHWPQAWSIYFAGGGVKGGQVVGATDEQGAYPADRPVEPAEVVATIYHALGLDLANYLPSRDGLSHPLVDPSVQPINELF